MIDSLMHHDIGGAIETLLALIWGIIALGLMARGFAVHAQFRTARLPEWSA